MAKNLKNKLEKVGKKKNKTWNSNHEIIESAFLKLMNANKFQKFPTTKQLIKETGLSDVTIDKHLKDLSYDKFRPQFSILIPTVLTRFAAQCLQQPKAPEIKLFMQLIGWRETNEIRVEFDPVEAEKRINELFLK